MAWNTSTDLVKGDNLLFYLISGTTPDSGNTQVLAYATSCSLQIDGEEVDASNKFSCKWASHLGGRASYTISVDALYCKASSATANSAVSFDELLKIMVKGDSVGWVIGQEVDKDDNTSCENFNHAFDASKPYYYGKAAITSLSLSGGNNEMSSCSMSMSGDGEIRSSVLDASS